MKFRPAFAIGIAALMFGGEAMAETCKIEITGPKDQYKFIHVYDVATGQIVFRQAIRSGDIKEVTVSGDQVRVDWKLAGYTRYRVGAIQPCKGGNKVKV